MPSYLVTQGRVWYALMLHDIKGRYFGNGLGWIFNMAWPLGHMAVILALNSGRIAPYGDSIVLYAATGVIPFMGFNYPSRFLTIGAVNNRMFLSYPIINVMDIIVSRAILEIISFCLICIIFAVMLALWGIDVRPVDVLGAVEVIGASLLLGVGVGFFNAVLALIWPFWVTASILIVIVFWATCGLLLSPNSLPEPYRYAMSFNPTLHAVEWMRMSYYPNYTSLILDKSYLFSFAFYNFALGLFGLKMLEGKLRGG